MNEEEALKVLSQLDRRDRLIIYHKIQGLTSKQIGPIVYWSEHTIDKERFPKLCEQLGIYHLSPNGRLLALARMFGAFSYETIVDLVPTRIDAVTVQPSIFHSWQGFTLRAADPSELATIRAIEAGAYPDAVAAGDVCFEPWQLEYLMGRFPGAMTFLEDQNHVPFGYLCSYPVSVETAKSVITADLEGKSVQFPGARGDNQFFTVEQVIPPRDFKNTSTFAWYIDGVAILPWAPPYALLHLLHKARVLFERWLPNIELFFTITDRVQGEELLDVAGYILARSGFTPFQGPVWRHKQLCSSPLPWKCWVSTKK